VFLSTLFAAVSAEPQDRRDFHRLIDASAPKSDMGGDAGKLGPAPNCDFLFEDEPLMVNYPIQSIIERRGISAGRPGPSSRR
jgi:hypothetical protein